MSFFLLYQQFQNIVYMQNRTLILCLLLIIFSILLYKSKTPITEGLTDQDARKIFVVNLDKDTERFSKFIQHYDASDMKSLPIERYPAVVGKNVQPEEWLTDDALNELYLTEKNGYRTHHHSLTKGGVGCFLSHFNLAKQLTSDNDVSEYLIFEDDTNILHKTGSRMDELIKNAPDDWDVILFYTIRAIGHGETGDYNKIKSFWGMNGYIINKKGAQKLVDEVTKHKIDGQIDCYMSKMIQQGKLSVYSTKQKLVTCNSSDTNIQVLLKPVAGINPYDYRGYSV